MPTPNFNLPLINGTSPISIVNDMNSLATAADSAMGTLATRGDIDAIRTVANQAAKDATAAASKADAASATAATASQTASTALSQSNTAIATSEQAATTAANAQNSANSALDSVNKFVGVKTTRITKSNATDNGILNFTDASYIGDNATDGILVIETEWYYFVEGRGISVPQYTAGYDKAAYLLADNILPGITWLNVTGMADKTSQATVAFVRNAGETERMTLNYHCDSSSGSGRFSFWVIIPKVSTKH